MMGTREIQTFLQIDQMNVGSNRYILNHFLFSITGNHPEFPDNAMKANLLTHPFRANYFTILSQCISRKLIFQMKKLIKPQFADHTWVLSKRCRKHTPHISHFQYIVMNAHNHHKISASKNIFLKVSFNTFFVKAYMQKVFRKNHHSTATSVLLIIVKSHTLMHAKVPFLRSQISLARHSGSQIVSSPASSQSLPRKRSLQIHMKLASEPKYYSRFPLRSATFLLTTSTFQFI